MSEWNLQEPGPVDLAESSARPSTGRRQAERYLVRWKMAIVFEELEHKPTYHGRTHDLSLAGTGMLIGRNIQPTAAPVIVLLAPPPLHVKDRPRIIEIRARQLEAVYSGVARSFRLGFEFLEFKNDGLNLLTERLKHHQAVARPQIAKPVH